MSDQSMSKRVGASRKKRRLLPPSETRVRVHDADGTAPAGSNAASGPTYRIQIGGRYMDAQGNLYPRNVHNPNSPHYDPAAANATHIPWPSGVPLPW